MAKGLINNKEFLKINKNITKYDIKWTKTPNSSQKI